MSEEIFFITNRVFKEGASGDPAVMRRVNFDLDNNSVLNSLAFCKRQGEGNYAEIGEENFKEALEELLIGRSSRIQELEILFYVHGFSNLPESDIFPRTKKVIAQFKDRESTRNKAIMVVPVIWPCDNDFGIIKDYSDDQKAAENSRHAFSKLLDMLLKWKVEAKLVLRFSFLTHSMGNRVLMKGVKAWVQNSTHGNRAKAPRFIRNIFMMAADIPNESLESGEEGRHIPEVGHNVLVYFADDDTALKASIISNLFHLVFTHRLGDTGPEELSRVPKNVYEVDCDDFNNVFDLPKGHSYFIDKDDGSKSPAFTHLAEIMATGKVNHKRSIALKK
ncbi:alpha/beta hydrolase [Magnetococcales bacterium HHB-1]